MGAVSAERVVDLGRDLATAAPESDILDLLAVAGGEKPLAGIATCYTASGEPAWGVVDTRTGALQRDDLERRLEETGLQWHIQPVKTVREDDRTVTWYELLVSDGEQVRSFLEATGPLPSDRTEREYGEALGYPASAIEWFCDEQVVTNRTAFDVIRGTEGYEDRALTLAASVPYVPAPTDLGARDAIEDGRRLTAALGGLDTAAGGSYVESLLGERVDEKLTEHDRALHTRWRDPLNRAMHA